MNTIFWRKIVICEKPPIGYKLVRLLLLIFSFFYFISVWLRNFLYNISILKKTKVNAAVVSIGNITAGGTGKTPLVEWLCNYFCRKNITTAVLTRGYKIKGSDIADEPVILAKNCPKAQIMINPNRVEGAKKAIEEFNAKLLIMDDSFQHRKLSRDIDIVAVDATEPFGRERLLPAGFLREPLNSLKRADVVIITRANQAGPERIDEIKKRILKIKPNIIFASAVHKPICAKLLKDRQISFDELKNKRIYAFCGIGNPDAFFETLSELALNIVGKKVYNDHHRFLQSDIIDICSDSRGKKTDFVITTQKDWIKTASLKIEEAQIPFAYLAVEIEFISGQKEIIALIEEALKKICIPLEI